MANENGDYLSRFDRVERNLEVLTKDVVALAAVVNKQNDSILAIRDTVLGLHETTNQLLPALRGLIDRIPPENLR